MKANQHTPGPWTISAVDKFCIIGSGATHIGGVCTPGGAMMPESYDVANANARLIAASPDMLAALKLIARSDSFNGGTFVKELQQIAQKSINQATA